MVEPHYRLPFLSWLPRPIASGLVRLSGRGAEYDCLLLSRRGLRGLLVETGLEGEEITREALRIFLEQEWPFPPALWLLRGPGLLLRPVLWFIPTLVFAVRKP
jgi:hypothetical protein